MWKKEIPEDTTTLWGIFKRPVIKLTGYINGKYEVRVLDHTSDDLKAFEISGVYDFVPYISTSQLDDNTWIVEVRPYSDIRPITCEETE